MPQGDEARTCVLHRQARFEIEAKEMQKHFETNKAASERSPSEGNEMIAMKAM